MTNLLSANITTAVTSQVSPLIRCQDGAPRNVTAQFNFTYGSGGTTAKVWLQTSFDSGNTWCDVVCFSVVQTSLINIYNLLAATGITTAKVPTDGSLAANTVNDGTIGPIWRTKMTTTGTYAGGTTLAVDCYFNGPLLTIQYAL